MEERAKETRELEVQELYYKWANGGMPMWVKILASIVVIIMIALFMYRYFLVGKAVSHSQYMTALALSSPEIGLAFTLL